MQFETIHPYNDGNGRIGRLLIPLLFCSEGVLGEPALYPSLHFKRHRQQYYDLLQLVRTDGDWEAWILFFLEAVIETSRQAFNTARSLSQLSEDDSRKIEGQGRAAGSMLRVHGALQRRPVSSVGKLAQATGLSFPSVSGSIQRLVDLGIVSEVGQRKYGRIYAYTEYMSLLNEGTETTR